MQFSVVNIGKFKGENKSLAQIIFLDADWFFYQYERKAFDFNDQLLEEAEYIYFRARNIKIPKQDPSAWQIEYLTHPPSGNFAGFNVVSIYKPYHEGASKAYYMDRIDMYYPKTLKGYDKTGYKIFIRNLKIHIWESENNQITRKRCDDFFSDDANFILPIKSSKRQGLFY